MKKRYVIPNTFPSFVAFCDFVHSLPIAWAGEPGYQISGDGTVVVDGLIEGYTGMDVPPETVAPRPPMSVLTFRNLFTQPEKVAIYTAAKTVVDIEVWLADLSAASTVDLSHAQTIAGVNALEQFGLIGAGRAAQILGT